MNSNILIDQIKYDNSAIKSFDDELNKFNVELHINIFKIMSSMEYTLSKYIKEKRKITSYQLNTILNIKFLSENGKEYTILNNLVKNNIDISKLSARKVMTEIISLRRTNIEHKLVIWMILKNFKFNHSNAGYHRKIFKRIRIIRNHCVHNGNLVNHIYNVSINMSFIQHKIFKNDNIINLSKVDLKRNKIIFNTENNLEFNKKLHIFMDLFEEIRINRLLKNESLFIYDEKLLSFIKSLDAIKYDKNLKPQEIKVIEVFIVESYLFSKLINSTLSYISQDNNRTWVFDIRNEYQISN